MKIAIIDDQQEIRYSVAKILQRHHHATFQYNGEESTLEESIQEQGIELLIVDIMLNENFTGIDLIKKLKANAITTPIILMTAYTTPTNMIEASKIGIKDILQKPFDESELMLLVNQYLSPTHKDKKAHPLIKQGAEEFVGSFETMKDIYKKIGIAANNMLSVLIYGETGTGKELIAKLIHTNCLHHESDFIAINCASIPKELFESQLFGHEKGSFTSADKQHIGYAEQTGDGTLFLDEIGELDSELQSKLLRFLETKKFRRVGGTKELSFNGRIICATNANLKENILNHTFREDLYFRLSMLSISLPTLKERQKDIPILCEHFISRANRDLQTNITAIKEDALLKLQQHTWKGNIRELRNIIYSACLNARDEHINSDDLKELDNCEKTSKNDMALLCQKFFQEYGVEKAHELEKTMRKELLLSAFSLCPNITQLSSSLGISRNTLKKQLKEYAIYDDSK
ncbi:MAG: sigma-54 dependent transcriptional regulator [Sulfurospirillaceae bacterium]|nr:sigma-54 dependent transcriptional regulator [Sulfurospirillaceae bacterium]